MGLLTLTAWIVVLVAAIHAAAWLFARLDQAAWWALAYVAERRARRRP